MQRCQFVLELTIEAYFVLSVLLLHADHTTRTTTFIDPRLPLDVPYLNPNKLVVPLAARRARNEVASQVGAGHTVPNDEGDGLGMSRPRPTPSPQPVPPPRPPQATASAAPSAPVAAVPLAPTAYNDKVVAFLRQANIMDILKERQPSIRDNTILKDMVNQIRQEGVSSLSRLSHDVDLNLLLSLFEQVSTGARIEAIESSMDPATLSIPTVN